MTSVGFGFAFNNLYGVRDGKGNAVMSVNGDRPGSQQPWEYGLMTRCSLVLPVRFGLLSLVGYESSVSGITLRVCESIHKSRQCS